MVMDSPQAPGSSEGGLGAEASQPTDARKPEDQPRKRKRDMGRNEYLCGLRKRAVRPELTNQVSRAQANQSAGKRDRNSNTKRRRQAQGDAGKPTYAVEFSKEEIEAQERRPKKKHAVMIGYSGTGYKGMQLNDREKTIEGDLFGAMVAAGAISKANADDPKKSSWVRCARTDKGVHAAGNILSMNLIAEDDMVPKINEKLPPQIRVFGIQRTNRSFNAYHFVDSRVYEYLIPTHCFLPPHPGTFLGKTLPKIADEQGESQGFEERQAEVAPFWRDVESGRINAALLEMDQSLKTEALHAIFEGRDSTDQESPNNNDEESQSQVDAVPGSIGEPKATSKSSTVVEAADRGVGEPSNSAPEGPEASTPIRTAVKVVKAAYYSAMLSYRMDSARLDRVRSVLRMFDGTHNYHNYTIRKSPKESSASRHMRSVTCGEPFIRNDIEWLSIRIHGQSFMMHQIRKMVSMVALIIRCGTNPNVLQDTLSPKHRIAIPKAPGVGLLLERPVFDAYNKRMQGDKQNERNAIGFERFERDMTNFKQTEIYDRIFAEEPSQAFHQFFLALDTLRSPDLLYLSSEGIGGIKRKVEGATAEIAEGQRPMGTALALVDSEGEDAAANAEECEG